MDRCMQQALNFHIDSPFWDEALTLSQNEDAVPAWLCKGFILSLEEDYSLLSSLTNSVIQALDRVTETPALCLLAKALYHIIDKKQPFSKAFPCFSLPKAPENLSDSTGYDLVGLFPILAHARLSAHALAARGIPHDIIYDTFHFLRRSINESCQRAGRPCFDAAAFSIFPAYLYTNTLWIGRLRFEIHPNANRNVRIFANKNGGLCALMCDVTLHARGNILGAIGYEDAQNAFAADFQETENTYEGYAVDPATGLAEAGRTQLSKQEWTPIHTPGDTLLKVHIPSTGKLLKEDCEAAYERARQLFPKCYPEYTFQGFICCTWLLCPALRTFLKQDSNIALFQQQYLIFPSKNTAADVFLYVFNRTVASADEIHIPSLPEHNSMQRGVKKLLLAGTYVHQFNGFIPF